MSEPPEPKHFAFRQLLRFQIANSQELVVVPKADLTMLLDYIDELERDNYDGWEHAMGPDL